YVGAEVGDQAVADDEAAVAVEPGRRVEQAGVDEGDRAAAVAAVAAVAGAAGCVAAAVTGAAGCVAAAVAGRRRHALPPPGRLRASASSTAMRTATPISTCSRTRLRSPSATRLSISMPRFIGPGCMTSASGW